ncbi:MAG: hypothetical protein JXA23_04905 [Bacteroidales bacterium]|nr:hypothetical protein [Bacteroidales bacterium]
MAIKGYFFKLVFGFILFMVVSDLHAREVSDTLRQDDMGVKELQEEVHSPKKATLYSAILPGLGQVYNKKYWKIPLIYIGFGTIGYFIDWNNDNYQLFKTGYKHLTDDDPETQDYLKIEAVRRNNYDLSNPNQFNNLKTAMTKQQDYYRRNRDLLVIGFIAFYGINILDASVDAHFMDFDISDDLTLNWQPSMQNLDNHLAYCIQLRFNF